MIVHLSDWFHLQCWLLVFMFMNVQELSLHYPVGSHKDHLLVRLCSLANGNSPSALPHTFFKQITPPFLNDPKVFTSS